MADINQVITLGLGTPGDIPHFILFGLSPTGPVAVEPADGEIIHVRAADVTIRVESSDRVIAVRAEDRTILIEDKPTP